MADKSQTVKVNISINFYQSLIERLDKWIVWQKEERGYEVDRSHVMNVLLEGFLEKNDHHLIDNIPSLEID